MHLGVSLFLRVPTVPFRLTAYERLFTKVHLKSACSVHKLSAMPTLVKPQKLAVVSLSKRRVNLAVSVLTR